MNFHYYFSFSETAFTSSHRFGMIDTVEIQNEGLNLRNGSEAMSEKLSAGKSIDLTEGPVASSIWLFALPLIAGNLLQQFYNVADTLIVGRFLGAGATITAQLLSAAGIGLYVYLKMPRLLPEKRHFYRDEKILRTICRYSLLTCVQQSVMNFGILMVQGLINSYGVTVMAAFAAAVKIDSFAYMPVQDFGNAFSTFIAQNHGAGRQDRIRKGLRAAVLSAAVFCLAVSSVIVLFADRLMTVFISPQETEIIRIGTQYLHIEGACYVGIGCLFLLYGLYRGLGRAGVSVVLTVISLGTRVALAYLLSPIPWIGLAGIWWAVPIGWFLADLTGFLYFWRVGRKERKSVDNDL